MKINNKSNMVFGQRVPTEALLKSGLKIHSYEDGELLYKSIMGQKFPGHVGFHKQAEKLAMIIYDKNPQIKDIIDLLSKNETRNQKISAIRKIVSEHGKFIDVTI